LDAEVAAAAAGDQAAWHTLVDRHAQEVWDIARGFGLDTAAAAAICQLSWPRLVDHLDAVRTHAEISAWLRAAVEREARSFRPTL